ncbi:hypothetical protein BCV53_01900 [Parageobacillus thermoglucosidasius]|uniref:Uncharacterized protein n=1 Tax=Parageobacillus thermoglucosidasius TaxID=1426 RepID=A0AAN1D5C7_PARTM|nr:hypothetical protein AOT13_01895 [Parageobacillus thermoglucosidasius]ANZ28978.1 hypothetical protein BCV53_01900 [Parageobacillus thermoglucosidasius]APM79717.1 hypothetical protein BCV54_01910 [Parageobacillus thermoglucosidasius]KJX69485.1 hypothetical protein WH82_06935 [Parageobacillus thermoglucosidasius]MBY6269549.1 hypothetical protein [Parageobacillus thermoglucosidasius]
MLVQKRKGAAAGKGKLIGNMLKTFHLTLYKIDIMLLDVKIFQHKVMVSRFSCCTSFVQLLFIYS